MRWHPMAACTNGLGCWGTRRPPASCKKSLTRRKPPMNRSASWRLPSATKKLWKNPIKRDRRTRLQAKDQRIRGGVSVRLALAASVQSPWRSNSNGAATVARRLQGYQTLHRPMIALIIQPMFAAAGYSLLYLLFRSEEHTSELQSLRHLV